MWNWIDKTCKKLLCSIEIHVIMRYIETKTFRPGEKGGKKRFCEILMIRCWLFCVKKHNLNLQVQIDTYCSKHCNVCLPDNSSWGGKKKKSISLNVHVVSGENKYWKTYFSCAVSVEIFSEFQERSFQIIFYIYVKIVRITTWHFFHSIYSFYLFVL